MQGHEGTEIIGHRGAGGHAPENTEAALVAGIDLGASALEVDIQFTADGMPVVYHDRTLERMAGVRGRIREQTARELAGYDIGFRFGDDHRGLRILTLDEAARLLPRDIAFHVEIKDYDTVTAVHLKEVLGSLRRRSLLDRSLISSFSEKILSTLRGLDQKISLGLLVSGRARGSVERAVELGCSSLHPEASQTDQALVDEAHARGLKVFPYTANEPAQMKQLLAMGVDGIYTDFPGRLVETVGHRPRIVRTPSARGAGRPDSPQRHDAPRKRAERPPVGVMETTPGAQVAELGEQPAATEAPIPGPGAVAADPAEDPLRRKRRRGRRGGRRHRRKTEAPGSPESVTLSGESNALSPLADDLQDVVEPEAAEATGAEEEVAPLEASIVNGDAAPAPDAARKRRRRGRRGGRRHRRGDGPKDPAAGGGVPPGGQV